MQRQIITLTQLINSLFSTLVAWLNMSSKGMIKFCIQIVGHNLWLIFQQQYQINYGVHLYNIKYIFECAIFIENICSHMVTLNIPSPIFLCTPVLLPSHNDEQPHFQRLLDLFLDLCTSYHDHLIKFRFRLHSNGINLLLNKIYSVFRFPVMISRFSSTY